MAYPPSYGNPFALFALDIQTQDVSPAVNPNPFQKAARRAAVSRARSVPSSLDEIHKIVLSIGKLKDLPVLLIRHVYSFMSTEFMKSKEILGVATTPLNRRLKMKNDNRYHKVYTSSWTGTLRQLRQWHLARRLGFRSLRAIERVYDPMDHYPTNWV